MVTYVEHIMPIDKHGVYRRGPETTKPRKRQASPTPNRDKAIAEWRKVKKDERTALGTDAAWKRWENDR